MQKKDIVEVEVFIQWQYRKNNCYKNSFNKNEELINIFLKLALINNTFIS